MGIIQYFVSGEKITHLWVLIGSDVQKKPKISQSLNAARLVPKRPQFRHDPNATNRVQIRVKTRKLSAFYYMDFKYMNK